MSQKTCLKYVRDLSEKKRTIHGNLGEKRDTPDQLQNWSGVFYFPDRKGMEVVMKLKAFLFAVTVMFLCNSTNSHASGDYEVQHKSAVVIAMFGTTVEPATESDQYSNKN